MGMSEGEKGQVMGRMGCGEVMVNYVVHDFIYFSIYFLLYYTCFHSVILWCVCVCVPALKRHAGNVYAEILAFPTQMVSLDTSSLHKMHRKCTNPDVELAQTHRRRTRVPLQMLYTASSQTY